MSTSNISAIFNKLPRSGWEEFVHHLLTVDGVTFICSDNQRAVRFFSNSTILILFISSIYLNFVTTKIVKMFQFITITMKQSLNLDMFFPL